MNAKTIPTRDQLMQAAERTIQDEYEKFKQVSYEHLLKQRAEKDRKKQDTEKPVKPDDRP